MIPIQMFTHERDQAHTLTPTPGCAEVPCWPLANGLAFSPFDVVTETWNGYRISSCLPLELAETVHILNLLPTRTMRLININIFLCP